MPFANVMGVAHNLEKRMMHYSFTQTRMQGKMPGLYKQQEGVAPYDHTGCCPMYHVYVASQIPMRTPGTTPYLSFAS
jgi:hypothetical protein